MQGMQGKAALVTGGASGIGRSLTLELARQGVKVSIVDLDGAATQALAQDISRAGGEALALPCDVTDDAAQQAAFEAHMRRFGRLDYAVLNAGIAERGEFIWTEGAGWRKALDVNLGAVLAGIRFAVWAMVGAKTKGTILATASAGGLFPMPLSPVYAASKAGVIHAVQSLAEPLQRAYGIRIAALCPQFVDTPLVQGMRAQLGEAKAARVMDGMGGRLLTAGQVTEAAVALLTGAPGVGNVLAVLMSGDWVEPQRTRFRTLEQPRHLAATRVDPAAAAWASCSIPSVAHKVEVYRLSNKFREATRVVPMPVPAPSALPPGQVLVRQLWGGINASDINYTSGRYAASPKEAEASLPFDAGFEAVGLVAAVGPGVDGLVVGQPVASMIYKGFAEYAVMGAKHALPLPRASPQMVALLTSGLTASIGLEVAGRMGRNQTVLVTAAAGGTGQFAVQLAKLAGNHVVATCSSADKVALLKQLGADRVINYREESVKKVLKQEYPKGVDLVYESVGGEMFETCLNALAVGGRMVVIGMMSQYSAGWAPSQYKGVNEKLLKKSASISGFFLIQYTALFRRHLKRLAGLLEAGRLRVEVDPRRFVGVEAVADAVEWLHSGESKGKVVVQLSKELPPGAAAGPSKL